VFEKRENVKMFIKLNIMILQNTNKKRV